MHVFFGDSSFFSSFVSDFILSFCLGGLSIANSVFSPGDVDTDSVGVGVSAGVTVVGSEEKKSRLLCSLSFLVGERVSFFLSMS